MSDKKTFQKGDLIIRKGAPATEAYMVLKGQVEVYLEKDEKILSLAKLAIGAIFGESALFDAEEYGANVRAMDDVELLMITPGDFEKDVKNATPLVQEIIKMLIDRQRRTNEALLEAETREQMDLVFLENVSSV